MQFHTKILERLRHLWSTICSPAGQAATIVVFCLVTTTLVAAATPDYYRYAMTEGSWTGLWTQPFTLVVLVCSALLHGMAGFRQDSGRDHPITHAHVGISMRAGVILLLVAAMVVSTVAWQVQWWKPMPNNIHLRRSNAQGNSMIYATCNTLFQIGINCGIPTLKRLSSLEIPAFAFLAMTIILALINFVAYFRGTRALGAKVSSRKANPVTIHNPGYRHVTSYPTHHNTELMDNKLPEYWAKEVDT